MATPLSWEILAGLPAEGPPPKHFHTGHPTPWTESLVIRFTQTDGSTWIGNFQGRQDWSTKILLWPEAQAIVVLAMDNFYLVDATNTEDYTTFDSFRLADDALIDPSGAMLFVAASTSIHAFGQDRREIWCQANLDGYYPRLQAVTNGVLLIEVELELGEATKTIELSTQDGHPM